MDIVFELEAAKLGHSWRNGHLRLIDGTEPDEEGNYTKEFVRPCTCGDELWVEYYSWSTMSVNELFHRAMVEHVIEAVARANS